MSSAPIVSSELTQRRIPSILSSRIPIQVLRRRAHRGFTERMRGGKRARGRREDWRDEGRTDEKDEEDEEGGIGSGSYRVTVTVSSDGRRTESAERRRVKGCSRRW